MRGAAFPSPDMKKLLVISGSSLSVYDIETDEQVADLSGHGGWVQSCAWAPDGSRIVSGGNDGTVRLWDTETAQINLLIASLPGGESARWRPPLTMYHMTTNAWRWIGLAEGVERYPVEYLPYLVNQ
jgi:WD40 repeat protein